MANLQAGDFAGATDNGMQFLLDLAAELANLKSGLTQLITDHNAHTHSGVTTGAGATGAPSAASTATAGGVADTVDPTAAPT